MPCARLYAVLNIVPDGEAQEQPLFQSPDALRVCVLTLCELNLASCPLRIAPVLMALAPRAPTNELTILSNP